MAERVLRCPACKNVVPVAPECRVCGESLAGAAAQQAELDAQYGYSLQAVESFRQRGRWDAVTVLFLLLSGLMVLFGAARVALVFLATSSGSERALGDAVATPVLLGASLLLLVILPILAILNVRGARRAQFVLLVIGCVLAVLDLMSRSRHLASTELTIQAAGLLFVGAYLWSLRAMGDEKIRLRSQ